MGRDHHAGLQAMIYIVFYDPETGRTLHHMNVPDVETAEYASNHQGLPYVVYTSDPNGYVQDGTLHPMPPRPGDHHTFDYTLRQWVDPRTLDDLRSTQIEAINTAFEQAAEQLTAGYPATERLTWPHQQGEALAWEQDPSTATPFLDGIAIARGIGFIQMREKSLGAVKEFMAASQQLVGQRQRLKDRIRAATTQADIEAVIWP